MRALLAAICFCVLAVPASAESYGGPDSIYTGSANVYARAEISGPLVRHARQGRHDRRSDRGTRWSKRRGGAQVASLGALGSFAGRSLIARARAHIGKTAAQLGLPRSLWCSDFMNLITNGGTGSRAASSWAHAGRPSHYGCIGCAAVMSRSGGGHVGLVVGYAMNGNPILVQGNYNGRVAEAPVPRGRVYAYRDVSSL